MNGREQILARFGSVGSGNERVPAIYCPDLTAWYAWHQARSTLPTRWRDSALADVARSLGVPAWVPARPWYQDAPGIRASLTEEKETRIETIKCRAGTLTSRWSYGPDGDWWQVEYPVKSPRDLETVLEIVSARTYTVDPQPISELEEMVGDAGVIPLQLPRRPYSDVLHEFVGWGEGTLVLLEAPETVGEIVRVLEAKLQVLVQEVARLPGQVVLSPDNLDAQFVSPRVFADHLAESYASTTQTLHAHGKHLLVHVGGPIRRIVGALVASGVDGIQGIAGAPQSDLSMRDARALVGPDLTLWGGIPQDWMLSTYESAAFETAAGQVINEIKGDPRMILGIADRVPVGAETARIESLACWAKNR